MPGMELLIAFFMATLIFGYMPGPALLYTAARTLAGGRRDGWQAAFGLHVGGYLHVFAAAFGLAILFEAVPVLYMVLKLLGAVYLIWLGVRLLMLQSDEPQDLSQGKPARRAFWQSAAVEMLNPKTALFYLAFLPQFTDPAAAFPIWLQFLILGTVVNIVFSSADVLCVLLADRVAGWMRGPDKAARWMQRVGGGVLIGLGVKLAFGRS
ncbi:MAG: LysE family translocator [Pseudomonadota bacterium]